MRILQTLVSSVDFRLPSHAWRDALLPELVEVALRVKATVIVLPGGFWLAASEAAVREQAVKIAAQLPQGFALFGGIDLHAATGKTIQKGTPQRRQLPYFGIAAISGHAPHCWQQTSTTSFNAWNVPEEQIPGAGRIVTVGEYRVGVLICGELFSTRARDSISALRPDLVVDLGHCSMGTGVTRAMERMASDGGCAVVHTQHVASGSSSLHYVTREAIRQSVVANNCEYVGRDDRWASWVVRSL